MKTIRIVVDEPNWPLTSISIHGQLVDRYKGIPEPIGVHEAINYRATCAGANLPFLREYPLYFTPERLRVHLPYFRNCQPLY